MYTLAEPLALRVVGPDDQGFLDALYASSRADLRAMGTDAGFVEQLIRMQQRIQTMGFAQHYPDAQHWIVLQHDKAIGRLVVDASSTDVRLVDIVMLPEAQGGGVGTALLHAVQRFAQERSLGMSLAVLKSNTVARHLYARCGFVVHRCDALFEHMLWHPDAQSPARTIPDTA